MSRSKLISLSDPSHVGDMRREAAALAQQLSFNQTQSGRLGIIVTEIGSNLRKHAYGGVMVFRKLIDGKMAGIEVLGIDKGPGIKNVAQCLEDGYSTAGSPGTGLGAISRLSNFFGMYSQPERGTVVVARVWTSATYQPRSALQVGAICVPAHEGDVSGDAWSVRQVPDGAQFLLADGLGHGEPAARAADEAVRIFESEPGKNPAEIIQAMHSPLRSTRGASLAITQIAFAGTARYAGIGNISGVILDLNPGGVTSRSMVSHNGTVGLEMRRVVEFTYPWSASSTLIMHSDGLATRWKVDDYPGLMVRDPAIIAAVLFRDFRRGHDDASVLVARRQPPNEPN